MNKSARISCVILAVLLVQGGGLAQQGDGDGVRNTRTTLGDAKTAKRATAQPQWLTTRHF